MPRRKSRALPKGSKGRDSLPTGRCVYSKCESVPGDGRFGRVRAAHPAPHNGSSQTRRPAPRATRQPRTLEQPQRYFGACLCSRAFHFSTEGPCQSAAAPCRAGCWPQGPTVPLWEEDTAHGAAGPVPHALPQCSRGLGPSRSLKCGQQSQHWGWGNEDKMPILTFSCACGWEAFTPFAGVQPHSTSHQPQRLLPACRSAQGSQSLAASTMGCPFPTLPASEPHSIPLPGLPTTMPPPRPSQPKMRDPAVAKLPAHGHPGRKSQPCQLAENQGTSVVRSHLVPSLKTHLSGPRWAFA